jgi:hypothetical protein
MPNSRDILYRVGYRRTLIDIASAGYEKEKAGTMAKCLTSRSTVSSTLRTHSAWWLLARHSDSQREVLTLTHGGSEVLPVFSFREEADMYLLMERLGSDWQIRETDVGELASVLSEQCASVRSVALDPLPSTLAKEGTELVSLGRERFVSRVVRRIA